MCAHTAWLTRSRTMGWSHQHAFTCNTHTHMTCSHTTCSPTRHALLVMCTCSKCVLTHSQYTHTLIHMHTHGCLDTHRPTVTHLCPPLDAHTHPRTDRKTQAGPQRNKPRPHHTHDHLPKTHTTQEHTQEESYPVSHMDNPPKSTMHTGKDTRRATPATHTCLGAYTGSGVRTKSTPPALASTGPPTRWQVRVLTLGRGIQTPGAAPSFQHSPAA